MDFKLGGLFLVTWSWTAITFVSGETGALPPPSRLSVVANDDFCLNVTWSPPENWNCSACGVKYCITRVIQNVSEIHKVSYTYFEDCVDLENGVTYTVATSSGDCEDSTQSGTVNVSIANRKEKLVKDFKCYYYQFEAMNCTWTPVDGARDLQLYYRYQSGSTPVALEHCPEYLYDTTDKTGCHLSGQFLSLNEFYFLINGTRGLSTLKNTFQVNPRNHVKPEPPVLNHSVEGNSLLLQCHPPAGFPKDLDWICEFHYRSSKLSGWQKRNSSLITPLNVPYDQSSEFQVQVKVFCGQSCFGSSDWSEITSIGEDQPPDWSVHIALIAIPIVVTVCVIFLLVFFKRLRAVFLPQIPDPRRLFKELKSSKEEGVTAVHQGKGSEIQRLYVPEDPELCVNVSVEKPKLDSTP
ncbi:hypothetical protein GJAV_G00255840 [Gymnothorax javanicus]|nr:hypothetical protein GJAV_G00255840 [Gymnothorax javanicus]